MLFLVRYGEISLKSRQVRRQFEKALVSNIASLCKNSGLDASARMARGRIFIDGPEGIGRVLERCFGVVSFSIISQCGADLREITRLVLKAAKADISASDSFRIKVNRQWKGFPLDSMRTEALLGSAVVDAAGARVDLSWPDKTIYVEIARKSAQVFSKKTPGPGGMPFGSAGLGILLLSGRNSALAGWLMMKRGMKVIALHIGDDKKEIKRMLGLSQALSAYAPWGLRFLLVPSKMVPKEGIFMIAEKMREKERALGIVTGDLLKGALERKGAVYSPLVGMDEKELSALAERIGLGKKSARFDFKGIGSGSGSAVWLLVSGKEVRPAEVSQRHQKRLS